MTGYWVAVAGAALTVITVFELLRRRRLREKYAVLWLTVGTVVAVLALFPDLASRLSAWANVETPLNLLFFLAAVMLLVVSIQFSGELSALEEKTRTLAEEIGLLEERLGALAQRSRHPGDGPLDDTSGQKHRDEDPHSGG